MSEKEKKNADETLNIIEKILDYNKNAQKIFQLASKVDKGKLESKTEESIAERVKLKIKKEKKKKTNLFKYYFTNYQNPSDIYKKLRETEGKENEDQIYSIKEVLNKVKEKIKNLPENKVYIIEGNRKIINIAERILYLSTRTTRFRF